MFKNALEGVKKIYYSAVCGVASTALSLTAALFALLGLGGSSTFSVLLTGLFGGLAFITALASFIFEILGCYECSKDKKEFMYALYLSVLGIVMTGLAIVFNNFASSIFSFIASISSFFTVVIILRGLIGVFTDLDDKEMVDKGRKVLIIYGVTFIAAAVIEFVSGLLARLEVKTLIVTLLSIVAAIIAIVSVIFFLNYVKESVSHIELSTFKPKSNDKVEQVIDVESKPVESNNE